MPLFFQQDINGHTRLAVWHITEDEAFFERLAVPQRAVAHPHKRLQHLAGRYLLRVLFPDFPAQLIRIADTRKPFLEDAAFQFSISHCGNYAAAVVAQKIGVGIDIEIITDKAARIRHKFAWVAEWERVQSAWGSNAGLINADVLTDSDALIATLIWSCKEAVYKWYGRGEVDFKGHMQIESCRQVGENKVEISVQFQKEAPQLLQVHCRLMQGLWLSYVAV